MSETARAVESFAAALDRLRDALAQPKSEWTRDASIQRFEFAFETAWKAIKRLASKQGIEAESPRAALRAAHRLAWIDDDRLWLQMLEDRNRSSHVYDETMAEEIYGHLAIYSEALGRLRSTLVTLA